MDSLFAHTQAFFLFNSAAYSINPIYSSLHWEKIQWGGYLATAVTSICRPYFQETLDTTIGETPTRVILNLTPLLLVGGTSYYVRRSLKVAALEGCFFTFQCISVNLNAHQNARNHVLQKNASPTCYYERLAKKERISKENEDAKEAQQRNAIFEEALCLIASGEIEKGKKLYTSNLSYADLDRSIYDLDSFILNDSIKKNKKEAALAFLQTIEQKFTYSISNKDFYEYSQIIIKGYTELSEWDKLSAFFEQLEPLYPAFEKTSLRNYHTHYFWVTNVAFAMAKGYCYLPNKSEAILNLINREDVKKTSDYADRVCNLLNLYVEKQKDQDGFANDFVTRMTYNQESKTQIATHFNALLNPEAHLSLIQRIKTAIGRHESHESIAKMIEQEREGIVSEEYAIAYIILAVDSKGPQYVEKALEISSALYDSRSRKSLRYQIANVYIDLKQFDQAYALDRWDTSDLSHLLRYHYKIDPESAKEKLESFADKPLHDQLSLKIALATAMRDGGKPQEALALLDEVLKA